MKRFTDLIAACLTKVNELFPWDLSEQLEKEQPPLLIDVREPYEFDALHIKGSINVPRGILETACEYDYEETVPVLAAARNREVIVICRSGNRSVLAAHTLQKMGFKNVSSLKTGVRGWNDFEQPLTDHNGNSVDIDSADILLESQIRPDQRNPNG